MMWRLYGILYPARTYRGRMKGGWLNKDMRMFFKMAVTWSEVKPCLSGSVLNIIDKFGFSSMTPVQVYKMIILLLPYDGHSVMVLTLGFFTQAATIPLFMSNKDVAVEAVSLICKFVNFFLGQLTHPKPIYKGHRLPGFAIEYWATFLSPCT